MTTTDESVTDESTETTDTTDEVQAENVSDETVDETEKPDPNAGAKKALTAERKARKDAENELKALKAELALKDKPAEEQALEAARAEARAEATEKANERIIRSEVKAAATGKVKNPVLALKLIDTSEIEVGEDGEVDADAVDQAITDLLEQYPELSADSAKFTGTADQGAKGRESGPPQWTEADLQKADREGRSDDIAKAKAAGQLNTVLGIK